MRLLILGLGRMGLRHVRAASALGIETVGVEPRAEGRAAAAELGVRAVESLDELAGHVFDAGIATATADVRPAHFQALLAAGASKILLEKPLCQSRAELDRMLAMADSAEAAVSVNLYRRTLSGYGDVRARREAPGAKPLLITATTGASGLGCNGIHWIDFALWLSGSPGGRLLFGEVEAERIASGRGPQFEDLGGTGVYGFADGSRLVLSIRAGSSAPAVFSVCEDHHLVVVDQEADVAISYDRSAESRKPNYLYGQDYGRREGPAGEAVDLSAVSTQWLRAIQGQGPCLLPSLREAAVSHNLLFDLLETTGRKEFDFT